MHVALLIDTCHESLRIDLEQNGVLVVDASAQSDEEVLRQMAGATILVVRSRMQIDEAKLRLAPKLKIIARLGSGLDNIDEQSCNLRGITLLNSPEGNCDAVAEHVIGMMLAFSKKIAFADREVRQHLWQREANRGFELGAKTLGIIGYGNAGKALARKISGFDMRVLAFDKYLHKYGDQYAQETSLRDIQTSAHVISIHTPLTSETHQFINDGFLAACRNKPLIVNAARGQIVQLEHLIDAIQKGSICGACLDVLPDEGYNKWQYHDKAVYEKLIQLPNVVLTPHVAGWSKEAELKMAVVLVEKILTLINTNVI